MAGKCFMFILVIAMLIAAVSVLAWKYRRDDNPTPLGRSFPDPVDYVECPAVQIAIGEELNFTCSFDVNHAYRRAFADINDVVLLDKDGNSVARSDYDYAYITYPDEDSPNKLLFLRRGPAMTCSRQGKYRIRMMKDGTFIKPEHNVTITVKGSQIESETQQVLIKTDPYLACDNDTTQFKFSCAIQRDCSSYGVEFFGRTRTEDNKFNHKIECTQTYDNENGTAQHCTVLFTEAEVDAHHTLGCRYTDTRSNVIKESYLRLPACGHHTNCTVPGSQWTVNCTKKSDHIKILDLAECSYYRFTRCFHDNRPIFQYNKVPVYEQDNKALCDVNKNQTKPVCRLGWCKDYDKITKYATPGIELCPSTFDEIVPDTDNEDNQENTTQSDSRK